MPPSLVGEVPRCHGDAGDTVSQNGAYRGGKLEAYDERIEKPESAGDELQEEMQSALNSAVDMLQQGNTSLREENAVLRNHVEVLLNGFAELKERIDQHDVALATQGMVSHPFYG